MTIRNMKAFTDAVWDWGFLDGCFGNSGSRVGDIDGCIEHCGEVLILEGKPMRIAPPIGERWLNGRGRGNGQARLWRGLTGRGITVLIIYGEAADPGQPHDKTPERVQVWRRNHEEPEPTQGASKDSVRNYVARWWAWAERAQPPAAAD